MSSSHSCGKANTQTTRTMMTGEPCNGKLFSTVRRGTLGKGPQCTSPGVYPTALPLDVAFVVYLHPTPGHKQCRCRGMPQPIYQLWFYALSQEVQTLSTAQLNPLGDSFPGL